jgi:hypothetical protein
MGRHELLDLFDGFRNQNLTHQNRIQSGNVIDHFSRESGIEAEQAKSQQNIKMKHGDI